MGEDEEEEEKNRINRIATEVRVAFGWGGDYLYNNYYESIIFPLYKSLSISSNINKANKILM